NGKYCFSQYYEYLPYKRRQKENVASVLHMVETGRAIISKKEARAFNQDSLSITPLINPSLMAFRTMDGVVNHDTGNIFSYILHFGVTTSILGLCWLNKNPSKLLALQYQGFCFDSIFPLESPILVQSLTAVSFRRFT
ncbi:hypothetical protein EJD97_022346, partial [Solanum chilense]